MARKISVDAFKEILVKRTSIIYTAIILQLILLGCAQVESLSGGPKDTTPPRLDSNSISPKNKSVFFDAKTIEFKFNEFIVLDNPTENVVISPSVKGKPILKAVNKKLTIDLSEVELESNTTYTISLNGAVKDYTEGNDSLYQYVFSTGSFLDSLEISGTIEDAFTNKPLKNVSVFLYNEMDDSVIVNQIPKYFVRSNEQGIFHFQNLKPGDYKIAAVDDRNKNLKYDLFSDEKMGYFNGSIPLIDTNLQADKIRLFSPAFLSEKIQAEYEFPGKLMVWSSVFNELTQIDFIEGEMQKDADLSNDTLQVFWSKEYGAKKTKFIIDNRDTLTRNLHMHNDFKFQVENNVFPVMNAFDTLRIFPNLPAKLGDVKEIECYKEDSLVDIPFKVQANGLLEFDAGFDTGTSYKIILPEGLFTSMYDSLSPADTISFTMRRKEYYGNLFLKTKIEKQGFFELVNFENKVVFKQPKSTEFSVQNLAPGRYQLRFIVDENNNQQWDTGDYFKKLQPEKVIYYNEEITVRSNWDIELEWEYE